MASVGSLQYSTENLGENIYTNINYNISEDLDIWTQEELVNAVAAWYNQIDNFTWKSGERAISLRFMYNSDLPIGSFMQMVWKDTTELGFGVDVTEHFDENGEQDGFQIWIVGRYHVIGNLPGKIKQNVMPLKNPDNVNPSPPSIDDNEEEVQDSEEIV